MFEQLISSILSLEGSCFPGGESPNDLDNLGKGKYTGPTESLSAGGIVVVSEGERPFDFRVDSLKNFRQLSEHTVSGRSELSRYYDRNLPAHAHETFRAILPLTEKLLARGESITRLRDFKCSKMVTHNLDLLVSSDPAELPVQPGRSLILKGSFETSDGRILYFKGYNSGEKIQCESHRNPITIRLTQDIDFAIPLRGANQYGVVLEMDPDSTEKLQNGGKGLLYSTTIELMTQIGKIVGEEARDKAVTNAVLLARLENLTPPSPRDMTGGMRVVCGYHTPTEDSVTENKFTKVTANFKFFNFRDKECGGGKMVWAVLDPALNNRKANEVLNDYLKRSQA